MWKVTLLAILVISLSRDAAAICNLCVDGYACVNETHFQICFDNVPDTRMTYGCPNSGDICRTGFTQLCMPGGQGPQPACRGMQNCVCDGVKDGFFVCTSRTTYAMCHNDTWSNVSGSCLQNQLCDVQRGKRGETPCTNKCIEDAEDSSICDFLTPVDQPETTPTPTPTLAPTSTPTVITPMPPQSVPNAVCATKTTSGRYAYPNDTTCQNYIFCYFDNGRLLGRATACPTGRRFNAATSNCQVTRPTGCF